MAAATFKPDIARQFLEAVFRGTPPELLGALWRMPPRTTLWTNDPKRALTWAQAASKERANVYCAVALCRDDHGPDKRTSNANAAALVGFVADVDFAGGHGKKKNYPADADAATELLLATGLHPTIIVHSGNGLQAWWLFEKPWVFETDDERLSAIALSQAWGATIKEHARRADVEVDSVHDLARVLRVPGSLNWKDPENPKPVAITFHDDACRYQPADFEPLLLVKPEEPKTVRSRSANSGSSSAPVATDDFPWAKHEALIANSEDYAATWARTRKDLRDASPSGYDMALANLCMQAGMTEGETMAVLVGCRRRHGDQIKPAGYYRLTIGKALTQAAPVDDAELTREQRIEKIAHDLGMPLTNIQKITGTDPVYRFVLQVSDQDERSVEVLATQLINQGTFRGKIFALTDVPPRKVGPKDRPGWDDYVGAMAQAAEEIDAGSDATVTGEILSILEDYLGANRPIELEVGDLVEHPNHPFTRGGRVYFKANGLLRFATMNLGLKLNKQTFTQRLVTLDAQRETIAVKKGKAKSTGSFYGLPAARLELPSEGEVFDE